MKNINLDLNREKRRGYQETVFCEGKTTKQLIEVFDCFLENKKNILGTRATKKQYSELRKNFDNISYDEDARILTLIQKPIEKIGEVAICTAGASDYKVAQEASITAEFYGSNTKKYYDIGISGIERLLNKIEEIKKANVIIAIAGMEGALPAVITGLVDSPVIAVPTSVGYGTSLNGITALFSMLNSCAEGMTVVNIDNGFNAGYSANQINRLIARKAN